MDTINIKVIIGSTRQGRFGDKPAHWIFEEAKKLQDVNVELLDLRDYPMPFFEEAETPGYKKQPYANAAVAAWTKKISEGDAFIVITPEYNHGPSAVLKNAIDYVGPEWNKKPIGYVSYGSALGGRAVEMLRLSAVELQMAPIRQPILLPIAVYMAASKVPPTPVAPELFEPVAAAKDTFLVQLMWWARTLKKARAED